MTCLFWSQGVVYCFATQIRDCLLCFISQKAPSSPLVPPTMPSQLFGSKLFNFQIFGVSQKSLCYRFLVKLPYPLCAFHLWRYFFFFYFLAPPLFFFLAQTLWEMFLLHLKRMCLQLLLGGVSINVIRSSRLKMLFKSLINLITFLTIFQLL